MFRHCLAQLCAATSVEVLFRRVMGQQSMALDVVPIKKPLVEGSLSWFIEEGIEIVLVSGVSGVSHETVTEEVKRRAMRLLQRCGDGDALRGCASVKRCMDRLAAVQLLLRRLDLQVRVQLSSSDADGSPTLLVGSTSYEDADNASVLHCRVYGTDSWEPQPQEQHLADVSNAHSLVELLERALQVAQKDAVVKGTALATSSQLEVNRALAFMKCESALVATGSVAAVPPSLTYSEPNASESCTVGSIWNSLAEDPLLNWMVSPSSYSATFNHLACERHEHGNREVVAVSWELRDSIDNVDHYDVPFVPLRDTMGLIHDFSHESKESTKQLGDAELLQMERDGTLVRSPGSGCAEHISRLVDVFWSQPLLQAHLLQVSVGECQCGRLVSPCAEYFMRSCGRLFIDAWLSASGRPTSVQMMPLCLEHFDPMRFMRECVALEHGTRWAIPAVVGLLSFGYHVAMAPLGRVATATNSFTSPATAALQLLPWIVAVPQRPVLEEVKYQHSHPKFVQVQHGTTAKGTPSGGTTQKTVPGPSEEENKNRVVMRVINVADSLKKLGVVKGALKDDKLLYFDESGQTKLQFTEVDSVRGISRLVRYVRKTQSVEFTPVTVLSGSRAPYLLASRALAASTTSKPPPYSHFIRLPVPLVPGAFFSIRYASLYEMEYIERELLLIFVSQSEDPTKWPVQNPTPCFFNKWRATRAAIAAIMRHDPQFSYTLTRLSPPASEGAVNESKGGRNGAPVQQGDILLSIYSGGKVMQETTLPEQSLLLGVRDCLARYAAQWAVEVPPIEEVTLMIMEIRRGTVSTYRNILSSLLQYSELFRQTDDTMSLNLQITADLTICLAKVGKLTKNPSLKEVLGEAVFRGQFSMLLPIIDVHRRAHAFLMRYAKSESFSFRCFESSSSKNQEGDCSRKYRWELQQHSSKGSEAATVVQTEEGTTRHGALAGLLERIDQRPDTAKGHCNAFVASCESKLTVELYQAALARERGFERITHEYDVEQKALLVKGVPKQLASASNANNSVVIRAIPLTAAHPIGTFIHRYYRLELKLPDPPQLLNDEKLRLLCLSTIYGACAPHFSMPLPPLETALVCVREKQSWYSSLRLPSQLFALKGSRFVEFGCRSRGKHEGRREAVCLLYKSLHGHPSPLLQHYFSSLPAPSPSLDPGCGHRCIDVSGGEGAAARASANMYGELQRLVAKAVRTHVAYDGVVECRFSFITGITCRYVHTPSRNDELVELFSAPLTREEWLPLQLLRALMSCAARLYSPGELERELMRSAATWPSLFMDAAQNERLFCTTFLRRYLGLRVYEPDDVEECAGIPGALYLVEGTRCTGGKGQNLHYEASLTMQQAPFPPCTTVFSKGLASGTGPSATRARLGLWADVSRHLAHLGEARGATQASVDKAMISHTAAGAPSLPDTISN